MSEAYNTNLLCLCVFEEWFFLDDQKGSLVHLVHVVLRLVQPLQQEVQLVLEIKGCGQGIAEHLQAIVDGGLESVVTLHDLVCWGAKNK